jgi:hypothetical protein
MSNENQFYEPVSCLCLELDTRQHFMHPKTKLARSMPLFQHEVLLGQHEGLVEGFRSTRPPSPHSCCHADMRERKVIVVMMAGM